MIKKETIKIFSPHTGSGRYVGFRLKKDTPIEVYEKLNEINQSENQNIGEYFTELAMKDIFGLAEVKNENKESLIKSLIEKDSSMRSVVENIVKEIIQDMEVKSDKDKDIDIQVAENVEHIEESNKKTNEDNTNNSQYDFHNTDIYRKTAEELEKRNIVIETENNTTEKNNRNSNRWGTLRE